MRELHQQMSTEECNALKIIAAIVHHQSHSASRSISIKTSNKKAKDQYRIPWSLNWETDNTVAISINDSITLLASAHLLDRIAIHGYKKVRVIHYFSQITMFYKNSCYSRTIEIRIRIISFLRLRKVGCELLLLAQFSKLNPQFQNKLYANKNSMSREGMSKIPKILTTKRKGLQALLLLLLLQSEKIRFWRRFQGKIIYREFVQIFLVTFLELSRREGSLLLPWPFSNQVFFNKEWVGPSKKEAKFTTKGKKARDLLSAGFLTLCLLLAPKPRLGLRPRKDRPGKISHDFFLTQKSSSWLEFRRFKPKAHVSIFKVAVKAASYHILTKNQWFFCGFLYPWKSLNWSMSSLVSSS